MARLGSLFLPLLYLTSFLPTGAALEVIAPTSRKAQLGSDVTLPCHFTVDEPKANLQFLAIIWQFQSKVIVRYDTKGTFSELRRFINEKEFEKGNADLHIPNVTTSDIGSYKCTVIYSPITKSRDVELTVFALPSVSSLQKVSEENEQNRVLCSVTGFYPKDITVDLLKDGEVIEGSVGSITHMNNDGTFSINSTGMIPSTEKPKVLSCRVHHESLTAPLQQNLQLDYNGDNNNYVWVIVAIFAGFILLIIPVVVYKKKSGFQQFVVSYIGGDKWIDGEKTTLHCTASNCVQDVLVTWIIKNKDGTTCEISETLSGDKEEEQPLMSREYEMTTEKIPNQKIKGLYDITTKMTFIPSITRHFGSVVTCKIVSGKKVEEKTYQFKSIHAKPKFIDPVEFTLSNEDVQLSASLQRFYPQKMQISWKHKIGLLQEKIPSEEEIVNNTDATFSLKSQCTVPGQLFKDPTFKVTVTWKHESMDVSQSRELSVKDLPWRPQIPDYPIESVFQDDDVHLRCTVSNYFPDALTVKWFEKKKGLQDLVEMLDFEKYTIPKITSNRADNKTFTSRVTLYFKKSQLLEKDVEFICRVEHPSLEKPIQSSTLPLRDTEVQAFILNNIQGPQKWYNGEKLTLYCAASYCAENTKVMWFVTTKDGTVHEIPENPMGEDMMRDRLQSPGYLALRERNDVSDIEGLLDITTSLSFTPIISKHKKITIGCKIVSEGRAKEKTFNYRHLFAKLKVLNPIRLSMTNSGEVLCSLDIEEFYPTSIQIKWNSNETLNSNKVLKNTDGTYTVHSEYILPGSFFKDAKSTVNVSWKHDSMDGWESKQVSVLDKEFPWRPVLQDIPVPNLLIGSAATLRCEVSNVFPDVLNVRWLKRERNGQELFPLDPSDKYSISQIRSEKQKDNTFTYKSCLKFKPSINSEEGAEFICRVEHPSLQKPTEKNTGPLCIKGFPTVKDIVCTGEGIYSLDVDGIYPQKTTVSWKLSVQSSTEQSVPLNSSVTFKDSEDGSYKVTSTCDLTTNKIHVDKWSILQATVEHETLDSPVSKRIDINKTSPLPQENSATDSSPQKPPDVTADLKATIPEKDDHQRFIVGDIHGPPWWIHGQRTTLYCPVSYCPEDVNVIWTVIEKDNKIQEISSTAIKPLNEQDVLAASGYFLARETEKSDKEGLFNITSTIILVPSVSIHVGTYLTCKIISNGKTKEKKFQPESIHAKLQVLDPVKTTLCDSGDVLCSLDFQNIYPKHLTLNWTTGQNQLESKEEWKENADKTFSVGSQCTVPGNLFSDPSFEVCVTWKHQSLDKPESRVLSVRDLGHAWRPNIQEVPIPHVLAGKQNTLQYKISSYFPDALSVSWCKKEKGGQFPLPDGGSYKMSHTKSHRPSDNTYSSTASLVFTPSLKDQGSEIICRVEHPNLEKPIDRSTGPLQVKAKPNKRRPLKPTLGKEEVKFSLILENFYPNNIHIQWVCVSGDKQTCSSKEKCNKNIDNSFSVTSNCGVSENLLHSPDFKVRVTWSHESMDDPDYTELSIRDEGFPWSPRMEISAPHLRINEEATLQCTISNFFPNVLTGKWLKKDKISGEMCCVSSSGMYKISNIQLGRQTNNTYTYQSCLSFIPTLETEHGAEFIYQVKHPSLVQPMEKSTGALQVTEQQIPLQHHDANVTDYQNHPSHHSATDGNEGFETEQQIPYQYYGTNVTDHPDLPSPHGAADGYRGFETEQQIPLQHHDCNSSGYQNHPSDHVADYEMKVSGSPDSQGEEDMEIT